MAMNEIFSIFGKIGAENDEAIRKIDETVDHAKKADKTLENINGNGLTKFLNGAGDKIASFSEATGNYIDDLGKRVLKSSETFTDMAGKASSAFTSIGQGAVSVGNSLTSYITKPAIAATTALAGVTIGKGFQRLVGIDTARAKLQGLKMDAETIDTVMDNALASVKGTAFGLDEAATTAANAIASGVKPGKELEGYLTTIGDVAALAGTNMGEMGSIFNKVMTGGKIQAEELNQLGDRGVAVTQALADYMGVAQDEVRDLASEGKISAKDFVGAMEEAYGGAAAIMGATSFTAAFDNFMASVGRIGANFLDGDGEANSFFETVKKGLADGLTLLEPFETLAKNAGEAFGSTVADIGKQFGEFTKEFGKWDEEQQTAFIRQKANYLGLAVAAGPALVAMGKVLETGGKFGSVFAKGGKSIAGFTKKLSKSDGIVGRFSKSLGGIGDEGSKLNKVMKGAGRSLSGFTNIAGGALTFLSGLGSLGFLMAAIAGIVAGFGLIPEGMRTALQDTLATIRKDAPAILDNLSNVIETRLPEIMARGSELLTDVLTTITEIIPSISQVGQSLLGGLLDGMKANGQQVFDAVVGLITNLGQAFADNIGLIFSLGTLFITQLSQGIVENQDQIVAMAITFITQFSLALIEALPQLANAALQIIQGLISGVNENMESINQMATTIITALATSFQENTGAWLAIGALIVGKLVLGILTSAATQLIPTAISMIGTLAAGAISAKGILIAAAIALIAGFIVGIVQNWPAIKEKGREILDNLWAGLQEKWDSVSTWFNDSMAKFSEWAGSVDLYEIGSNILGGLWNGLKSMWESVSSWFSGRMEWLKTKAQSILSIFSPSRFFEWLGEMMFKGLGVGMEDEAPKAEATMSRDLESMKDKARKLTEFEAGQMNVPVGTTGSIDTSDYTYGNNQTNIVMMLFDYLDDIVDRLDNIFGKNNDTYLDGKLVSENVHDPLSNYSKTKEMLKMRTEGRH